MYVYIGVCMYICLGVYHIIIAYDFTFFNSQWNFEAHGQLIFRVVNKNTE